MPARSDAAVSLPPTLFVFSGPSGVGKDSVMKELRRAVDDLYIAVTGTTREPRPGEVAGKSYHFMSRAEYDRLLDAGQLLAPAEVHGSCYGVPISEVKTPLDCGQDVILRIDVQGAIELKRRIPQAVFIFLAPPSYEDLAQRLRARHTESPGELERRLKDARFEMQQLPRYEYAVVNGPHGPRHAAESVACIISAERLRTHRRPIDVA